MKKKILILLAVLMALTLVFVACKDDPVDPADTTLADTTAAEEPTQGSDEPTEAPDTDPVTPTEEDTTTPEEPTESEEPTDEPDSTDCADTEVPTETDPVETVDPMAPVSVFVADDIKTVTGGDPNNMTQDCLTLEDGYIHVVPIGPDPYWYPFAGVDGARYIAIRYRTDATGANMQLYMASTGNGPTDDTSMIQQPIIADSEWHVIIFDTQSLIDAGIYNGEYVSYFRFDPLEAGYILNEEGEPWKDESDQWVRYTLPEGCSIDIEYIAFFHSEEAAKAYDIEIHKAPMWDVDKSVVTHLSFDELDKYAAGNKVEGVFAPGNSAGWDMIVNLPDFSVDTLRFWGWVGVKGTVGQFGYQINGGKAIYEDAWTVAAADDVKNAAAGTGADDASRMEIMISVAGLYGTNTVNVLYKNAEGVEVCLAEFTVNLPALDDHNFQSDAASNFGEDNADVNMKDSDLANLFEIVYGQGDSVPAWVVMTDNGPVYKIAVFNAISAMPNGMYAFSVKDVVNNNPGFSSVFVRAIRNASPEKQFFGADGGDASVSSHGGSGIYLAMEGEDTLRINIKSYENGGYVSHIYKVEVDSRDITVVDDGSTVYIIVGDKLAATVAISGTADYAIDGVGAEEACATATLSLCDGTVVEIPNAILAASCDVANSVGIATRGGGEITFSAVSLMPANTVEIPEMVIVLPPENIALGKPVSADSVENETNIAANATDGDETTRWGALPNGLANLTVDLEGIYSLTGMKILFENASWNYTISVSTDGENYTEIYAGEKHTASTVKLEDELNGVTARYIKFTRLEDDGATQYWFSIYELYVYGEKVPTTPEEIVDAAYALESGEDLAGTYTLTGVITEIDSPYSSQYGNISVWMVVGEMTDKPILAFRLTGEGADALKVGDTITVTGSFTNYNGKIEYAQGCTLDAVVPGEGPEEPTYTTPEEIVNAAYALEVDKSLSKEYTLTGAITEIGDPYNEQYGNITVTIVVGEMTDKPIVCYRMKGEGIDAIAVGDTITVTGTLKNYGGTIEFTSCTMTA